MTSVNVSFSKSRIPVLLLAVAVLFATISCVPVADGDASAQEKQTCLPKQTVMIYMVGSDLESDGGAATKDMEEIRTSGVDTGNTNVIVYTGGSRQWTGDIPADANMTYRLNGETWEAVRKAESANMGSPEILSAFLIYCREQYPADSYALILWDHGGGPIEGYGYDERHELDHLTLPEMRQALQNSPFGPEKDRLLWVGFDACLMASLETAAVFSDFADYMIASQEAVPSEGWNYAFLSAGTEVLSDGKAAARCIIDGYAGYYYAQNERLANSKKSVTLSCLDLKETKGVERALDALSAELSRQVGVGEYSTVAKVRNDARAFGRFTLGVDYDLVDLKDLATEYARQSPQAADAVCTAIDRFVVYQQSNQQPTGGVSVFFPYANKTYLRVNNDNAYEWQSVYRELGFAPSYASFLYSFSTVQTGAPIAAWTGDAAPIAVQSTATGEYYLQLTPEQIENYAGSAFFVLRSIGGEKYMPYIKSNDLTLDDTGCLHANFNNKAIYFTNDTTGSKALPLQIEEEVVGDVARYSSTALLSRWEEDAFLETAEYLSCTVLTELDRSTGEATVTGIIPSESESDKPRGKQEVNLADWNYISFTSYGTFVTRDASGAPLPVIDWETSGESRGWEFLCEEGFTAQYLPLAYDPYPLICAIIMQDTQGNLHTSPLMPVQTQTAQEETPDTPGMPIVRSYEFGSDAPVILLDNADVTVILTGMCASDSSLGLELLFDVQNKTDKKLYLNIEDVCIGDVRVSDRLSMIVGGGRTAQETLFVSLDAECFGADRQEQEMETVTEASFLLCYALNSIDAPERLVTIKTDFELAAQEIPDTSAPATAFPLEPQMLYRNNGVSVRLHGAAFTEFALNLFVETEINNAALDKLLLRNVSVNGVMLDSTSGLSIYGPIRDRCRTFGCFRISIDNLRQRGISSINDISFSIDLCGEDLDAPLLDQKWVALTSTAQIRLFQTVVAAPDASAEAGARVLLDANGIKVTQLPGAAEGTYSTTFLCENNTPFLVNLHSRDGLINELFKDTYLFYSGPIAPGKRAYTTLTLDWYSMRSFGIETVDSLRMRLLAVDETAQALLFATGPIDITF